MESTSRKIYKNRDENVLLGFKRQRNEQKKDTYDISINSLSIDTDCFITDKRFSNIVILSHFSEFFVCGRLYMKSYSLIEKMERIKLDINLNHPHIPPIFGFDSGKTGYEVLEIRKIIFEPVPFTKQTLSIITTCQLFKIIDQIIDFFNYILKLELSITLLTLDDLFSVAYLDNENNIYFGDLSFIESRDNSHKSLYSLGIIIYQLFGGEISFEENHAIRKSEIDEEIPFFWRQFILTCIDEKINIENFYSPLIDRKSVV